MTYKPSSTKIEGNIEETQVSDDNTQELLAIIVSQLRLMNLHLEKITDLHVNAEDLGD